ncbi:hypothetical protein MACJ_003911 [Theileria orientalis]|uniref:Uncharacterized protein n=1 Tax=Theileria orientalis TaxID=68886 RepID=A0A976SKT4_THEOR|nr:hypothetical protein MACJ_003911 [Theileria orientalis]
MIMLYIVCIIIGTRGHNMERNDRISVTINIPILIPNFVKYRYAHNTHCGVYEIPPEDRDQFKIGAVYEYGILVYGDSDILVERKVYKLLRMATPASIFQINSKYNKSGQIIGEIIELVRLPQDNRFREIIRKAYEVNLKEGYINNEVIKITKDQISKTTTYEIRSHERLKYMIGEVKYGDIIVDNYFNTVTYKVVHTYEDVNKNIIVEVNKMLKTAEFIRSKCMMIFDDPPETGFCQELEVNVTFLYT